MLSIRESVSETIYPSEGRSSDLGNSLLWADRYNQPASPTRPPQLCDSISVGGDASRKAVIQPAITARSRRKPSCYKCPGSFAGGRSMPSSCRTCANFTGSAKRLSRIIARSSTRPGSVMNRRGRRPLVSRRIKPRSRRVFAADWPNRSVRMCQFSLKSRLRPAGTPEFAGFFGGRIFLE